MEASTLKRAKAIELLVLDVDGVLTDGSLFYGPDGEALKRFHVHDGAGIKTVLAAGIKVAVISARQSPAVQARMRELGVEDVQQGCDDKLQALQRLMARLNVGPERVACIGDDLTDVPMMRNVGLSVAVLNAQQQAIDAAHYTTAAKGGHGAVREVCNLLLVAR